MATCTRCGREFSSFYIGANPPAECRTCRAAGKLSLPVSAAQPVPPSAQGIPAAVVARVTKPVVTLTFIGINSLVFVAMLATGASLSSPSLLQAVRWGADFGPLTVSGEWWRPLTSTFIHFGAFHIAMNMWCLWAIGRSLEMLIGRKPFAIAYLLTGIAASLTSLAWDPLRISAGASGAVFGITGVFISHLALKKSRIDPALLREKLKSLAVFVGYNLLLGIRSGVDNSAHVGGLVAGLILGCVLPSVIASRSGGDAPELGAAPDLAAETSRADAIPWAATLASCAVLLAAAIWIHSRDVSLVHYGEAVRFVERGQWDQGIAEMQKAAAPGSTSLMILADALIGEWQLEQNHPVEAIPPLEHALALAPESYDLQHNLALAYLGDGRPNQAYLAITSAMKAEADDWRGHFVMALAAEQSGHSDQVSQNIDFVLKAQPDFAEAKGALDRFQSGQVAGSSGGAAIPYAKLAVKSPAWPLYP